MRHWGLALLVCVSACAPPSDPPQQQPLNGITAQPQSVSEAQLALEWMQLFRALVKNAALNPPAASRVYAYAGIALFESIARSSGYKHSLAGQLNALKQLPDSPADPIDADLVLNETLLTVAKGLFPNGVIVNPTLLNTFYEQKKDQLTKSREKALVIRSQAYGQQLGQTLLKWAQADQYKEIRTLVFQQPSRLGHPEFWQATDPGTLALEPYWGRLRTFSSDNDQTCQLPSTIPFATSESSDFYKQASEVYATKEALTAEEKAIAWWWADGAGTATPAGHWIAIIGNIAQAQKLNRLQTARAFALVGIGMADAFISCWDLKYKQNLLRPETYIQEFLGKSGWKPLIKTPPFPEYPSGHSVSSGAAAEILTQLLGAIGFSDSSNQDQGYAPRSFANFHVAAQEAASSRLYGGIHYADSIQKGLLQGRCIGRTVMERIKL